MCRALRRAGRGVLKGGGSARGPEGRGAGGELEATARLLRAGGSGSATLESGEEEAARLYGGRRVGGGSAAKEGGE